MRILIAMFVACIMSLGSLHAAELPTKAEVKELANQAKSWLLSQQQADGSFFPGDQFKLGITTLTTIALLDAGMTAADEPVAKAAAFIASFAQPDGGIYNPQEGLGNYGTSLSLRVLVRTKTADEAIIKAAQKYILGLQNTDENAVAFGGIGYGSRGDGHEDLSNTSMAVEALIKSGVPADDPAMQRALKFISRCQNLSSTNDMEWAGQDGGAAYSPDNSMALGSYHDGTTLAKKPAAKAGGATQLNSYGSMTYAMISSYILLDVKQDDPRLKAALKWVNTNYQFEVNPGMAARQIREGLFYYYQAMAKTYDIADITTIDLGKGKQGDWRADLFTAIKQRAQISNAYKNQEAQAFWMNDMPRWGEGIPHLTTSYMLTSLMRIYNSLPE